MNQLGFTRFPGNSVPIWALFDEQSVEIPIFKGLGANSDFLDKGHPVDFVEGGKAHADLFKR